MSNPLKGWQVRRGDIRFLGHDLQRPECILAERDGTVWTADGRGGVMRLGTDGGQQLIVPPSAAVTSQEFETRYVQSQGSLPNGLAFTRGGDFIIANWGTDAIEIMSRSGEVRTICSEIDGQPLGKANFPLRDSKGRVWFSVTTREQPWTKQLNSRANDGYVALLDEQGARIVADGFCGTNEIRFDRNEEWLYVVESTGRRISRLRVRPDGSLTDREVYGPSDLGGHPDGFAFDAYGNLWITLIFADRLVALTPEGELLTLLDDGDAEANAAYEQAFAARNVTPGVMAANCGALCPWMASLTFGGPDLRTVYLGSLRGTAIPFFRSPVPGAPMIHWGGRG
ncbi:gluconolactonase [Deinococcus aerius]|uniref:Gluconolactonase n=1 Tax=Deinococcus aerius TaxID=200253 RepID=A0A2I9DN24_9DEIO|nr:SMP-30/gluconolactonase/LRE family protein [Deinococcus aerius]GBF07988.1 gluconolactonase [Deinococcus aerius]